MPLFVKDYRWEQSSDCIYLVIPLKGAKASSISILQSQSFLKVSFPPYLFEVPFWGSVVTNDTFVKVSDGHVNIKLRKNEEKQWPDISMELPENSDEKKRLLLKLRNEAVDFSIRNHEKEKEEKVADRNRKDRFAVSQQIKLEQEERKRIEDYKNAEKNKFTRELLDFQEKLGKGDNASDVREKNESAIEQDEELKRQWEHYKKLETEIENMDSDEDELNVLESNKPPSKTKTQKPEVEPQSLEASENDEKQNNTTKVQNFTQNSQIFEKSELSQPKVRGTGDTIGISFTPRVFPTPARESKKPEEDEWLRKQAEARQRADVNMGELTEAEKDPVLLRQKGNSYFQQQNYQGAVNVFTHAINLFPKMPELYNNRAACHLKLRNLFKALDDSSKAIELLTPPVESNRVDRMKAHIRRGTAFCELECYTEGLIEYEAALKCDPQNPQIQTDCDRIRNYIQGSYSGELIMQNPDHRPTTNGNSKSTDQTSSNEDEDSGTETSEDSDDCAETEKIESDDVSTIPLKKEKDFLKFKASSAPEQCDSDDLPE